MRYVLIALGVLCALILIYVFLIFPSLRKKTDIFKKQPLYAHRGLFGGDMPENSMAAFAAAVDAGYGARSGPSIFCRRREIHLLKDRSSERRDLNSNGSRHFCHRHPERR